MPDFPQWSQFQAPGGGADLSYVGPVAGAYADAARTAVHPISRVFEQLMAQRAQERAMGAQMAFEAQQQERQRQDQLMLQREQDTAALARVNAQIAAQQQQEAAELARSEASALAARDLMAPVQDIGSVPFNGSGAWSPEAFLRMPQAQSPGFAPISDQQARALGPQGVANVTQQRGLASERAQSNREQQETRAGKQAEAQAAAQVADQFRASLEADADLDDKEVRRLSMRSRGDFEGAQREYAEIMGEKRKLASEAAQEKAKAARLKETGVYEKTYPGIDKAEYPLEIREGPRQGVTDQTKMSLGAQSALWAAARKAVSTDKSLMGTIIQADAMGLLPATDPNYGASSQAIRQRASEIAEQEGWQRHPEVPNPLAPKPQQAAARPSRAEFVAGLKQQGLDREQVADALMAFDAGGAPADAPAPKTTTQTQPKPQVAAPKTSAQLREEAGGYVNLAEERAIKEAEKRESEGAAGAAKREAFDAQVRAADAKRQGQIDTWIKSSLGRMPQNARELALAIERLQDRLDRPGGYDPSGMTSAALARLRALQGGK